MGHEISGGAVSARVNLRGDRSVVSIIIVSL